MAALAKTNKLIEIVNGGCIYLHIRSSKRTNFNSNYLILKNTKTISDIEYEEFESVACMKFNHNNAFEIFRLDVILLKN